MQNMVWEVKITRPPSAVRYCKKCGTKTEYENSGFFRINAQKKVLDIWLIYKCRTCDTTWNATLFTRMNPQKIERELLERFHGNDPELIRRYAMDTDMLRRNGAEFTLPEYRITGPVFDMGEAARLLIRCDYPLSVRMSAILREKLGLSHRRFTELLAAGAITSEAGEDLGRCKLVKEMTICWQPESLTE